MAIYIGKLKPFGQYESLKGYFNMNDMAGSVVVKPNEKGFVNIIVNKLREPDKNGNTHSIQLDEWKPKQQAQPEAQQPTAIEDNLPF